MIVSIKAPEKDCWQWASSDFCQSEDFQGIFRQVKQWQFCGTGAIRENSKPICLVQWLLVYWFSQLLWTWGYCFSRLLWSWRWRKMEDGVRASYNPTNQLFLLRFNHLLELFIRLFQFFGLFSEFWRNWFWSFFPVFSLFWWRGGFSTCHSSSASPIS